MRSIVPSGKRPGICSELICVLPMGVYIGDIRYLGKAAFYLISPIAFPVQSDIFYSRHLETTSECLA